MFEWLRNVWDAWGPYVLFTCLEMLLYAGVSAAYRVVTAWLDRRHPDDLPCSAGEWVSGELAGRGLDGAIAIAVSKSERGVDAYWPNARMIVLSRDTYLKHDPSYWAIAAHELGHALSYRSAPSLGRVFEAARVGASAAGSLVVTFLLANLFLASSDVVSTARVILMVAIACRAIVLIDEATASWRALRMLRDDGRLESRQRRAAWLTLAVAYSTYLAAIAGELVLLDAWPTITATIPIRIDPADPLTGGWLALAAALSLGLLAFAAYEALVAIRRRKRHPLLQLRGLLVVGLVAVVWNQPLGTPFVFACLLALVAARSTLQFFLLPVLLVFGAVVGTILAPILIVGRRLIARHTRGETLSREHRERLSRAQLAAGEAQVRAARAREEQDPPWYARAATIAGAVLHLPLVALFWFHAFTA